MFNDMEIEVPLLDSSDRCDWQNCHAQAKAVIWFAPEQILTFCRHHTEANAEELLKTAWFIDRQYEDLYN